MAQPIDQSGWIKFRGPILMMWSSLRNFRFVGLPSRSESRCKVFPLEPHFEATRNDPDPKKIPRAYFDLLNLCAKFQSHISTESTSNPSVKNTPKCMIWTSLVKMIKDLNYTIHSKLLTFKIFMLTKMRELRNIWNPRISSIHFLELYKISRFWKKPWPQFPWSPDL